MPRKLDYLSPSGMQKFDEDQEQFYVRYLCSHRLPDEPQTCPMSVGSSFDAYAKSFLYERLFGKGHDPKYDFTALFEAQVEAHNRDQAIIDGKYAFDCYQKSGALADLMLELQQAVNVPKFEIEVKGVIHGYREGVTLYQHGVTFLGKPDVFFINKHGAHVILDWKVNGFYSKYNKSPMPGYIRLRQDIKKSGHHKDCTPWLHNGTVINIATTLDKLDDTWARQLSIYSWLLGCSIGEDFIAGIDQLCCSPSTVPNRPNIRIAEHRLKISPEFQFKIFAKAQEIWELSHSDHFFRLLTKEESLLRCQQLDDQYASFIQDDGTITEEDRQFLEMTRANTTKFKGLR